MVTGVRLGVLSLVLLAACGDNHEHQTCLPACEGVRDFDAIAYDLRARFDAATGTLHASVDVTVVLGASPVIALDAAVEVDAIRAGDYALPYHLDDEADRLRVDLGPVAGGGEVVFTIDYRAGLGGGLFVGGPRDGDPVTSRVLFTDSEPFDGRYWLPAKHDPADRARFSSQLTVAPTDDVIGNGERIADERIDGQRRITHRLDQPIPTYLMAFAAGELESHGRLSGDVPIAIWHRRGAAIDTDAHLDLLDELMTTFSALVGPYPWSRYAVVLLPQFGGGMENATITFNSEASGQAEISFYLNAHELAHQWFGDWVTMRTYRDLWTKEGMATFLAAEATRTRRDLEERGRLFGTDFPFFPTSPIVELTDAGLPIYSTGPYERAAWLLTQLRVVVGEAPFWAGLRKVLADHALDSVDAAQFLAAFEPALPAATRDHILGLLDRADMASLAVDVDDETGAMAFSLGDPAGVMLAPLTIVSVDAAGRATTHPLVAGASVTIDVEDGGYLAPDERGVHPDLPEVFDADGTLFDKYYERLAPRFVPQGSSPALAELGFRSPSHQERAMAGGAPVPPPANFRAFFDDLDSLDARFYAIGAGCASRAALDETGRAAMDAVLAPILRDPPIVRYGGFAACGVELPTAVLGDDLTAAAADLPRAGAQRLEYLLGFDYGPATSLALIGRVAREAPLLRVRERALSRLTSQTLSFSAFSDIPEAELPAWRTFFLDLFPITTTRTRLQTVWRASTNLRNLDAPLALAPLLHTVPMTEAQQVRYICEVDQLLFGQPARWAAFRDAIEPTDDLWPGSVAVLADPDTCPPVFLREAPDDESAHDLDTTHDHVRLRHGGARRSERVRL